MKNLLIILTLFLIYSGCNNDRIIIEKTDNKNYSKKIEQIIDNDFKKEENKIKIDSLNRLLAKELNSNILIERGFYLLTLKEYVKAKEDFNRVLEADPKNIYANVGMALYFSRQNQFENSVKYVDKSIKIDSLNALAFNIRSGNYKSLNEDSMLSDINKSIKLSNTFQNSYVKRALIYSSKNLYEKAMEDINLVIRKTPNNPAFYRVRIFINQVRKNYKSLIEDYSRLTVIDPESQKEDMISRAKLYKETGEFKSALIDFKKIEELNVEFDVTNYFEISGLYARLGKTDSCLIYAKKAIEKGGYTKADFEKDSLFSKVIKKKEFQEYLRR